MPMCENVEVLHNRYMVISTKGTVAKWYAVWTSAPAAGVRYSVVTVFPLGYPAS